MIAVLSHLVRVSQTFFSIGPCFLKAVLPLVRFLWKLLPDWFMFWESRSSIGLCYSSKFMASWILPVVQDFVPIQDFFLLEQVHKPCCPLAHVHHAQVSYWSIFVLLLVQDQNPRPPIGLFLSRFLLYALPCMILAIGINIPKFFEVDLIFRWIFIFIVIRRFLPLYNV